MYQIDETSVKMEEEIPFAADREWIGLLAFVAYLLIIIISTAFFWMNRKHPYIAVRSVNTTLIHVLVQFLLVCIVFPSRFIWAGVFPCVVELWSESILTPTLLLFLVAKIATFIPEYQLSRRRLEVSKSAPTVSNPLPLMINPIPILQPPTPKFRSPSSPHIATVTYEMDWNGIVPLHSLLADSIDRSSMIVGNAMERHSHQIAHSMEIATAPSIHTNSHESYVIRGPECSSNGARDWKEHEVPDYYFTNWTFSRINNAKPATEDEESQMHKSTGWSIIRESVAWKIKLWLAPKSLFKLALIQAFVNLVILLSLQGVTTDYHIFPYVDYSELCSPRTLDSIPLLLETAIYVLILEPIVLYLGRKVKDEFDLRFDVLLAFVSGMGFSVLGIIFTELAVMINFLSFVSDAKLWIYVGALVSHSALVILPVIRSRFMSCPSRCEANADIKNDCEHRFSYSYHSFHMILNTLHLFEELKEFSVGTLSVENCLFIERVRQFKHYIAVNQNRKARKEMDSIVKSFIEEGSPCEVNILGHTRKVILASVTIVRECTSPPPIQLFDTALTEVIELVYRDTYPAFHKKACSC